METILASAGPTEVVLLAMSDNHSRAVARIRSSDDWRTAEHGHRGRADSDASLSNHSHRE